MATYKHRFTPATGNEPEGSLLHVVERPFYGSLRLGVDAQEVDLAVGTSELKIPGITAPRQCGVVCL